MDEGVYKQWLVPIPLPLRGHVDALLYFQSPWLVVLDEVRSMNQPVSTSNNIVIIVYDIVWKKTKKEGESLFMICCVTYFYYIVYTIVYLLGFSLPVILQTLQHY